MNVRHAIETYRGHTVPHFRHRPQLRRVAVLLAAVVLAAMLPAAAQAHSFLIRSTPEAGARLVGSPRTLTLYFSESVERKLSGVQVVNSNGERVDDGVEFDNSDDALMRVKLKPLSPGYLTVKWATLSAVVRSSCSCRAIASCTPTARSGATVVTRNASAGCCATRATPSSRRTRPPRSRWRRATSWAKKSTSPSGPAHRPNRPSSPPSPTSPSRRPSD